MEYFATVADKRFILDWTTLPANSQDRIIRYGVQRIINDRCGGSDRTEAEKHDIAQKMLDALKSGELPTRGSGGDNPVLVESRRLALKAWLGTKDQAKAKDRAAAFKDMEAADKQALADKIIAAQNDEWRKGLEAAAKAEVARKEKERAAKRKAVESVATAIDVDI